MSSHPRLAAMAMALLGTAAAAPDLLPLKHGIYVPAAVACRGASNADMVNYWGGRSSIGTAGATCTIKRISKAGTRYTVTDTCRDIGSGQMIDGDPTVVTIAGPTAFRLHDTDYKYCGPRPQF